jgi:hypothetical protein
MLILGSDVAFHDSTYANESIAARAEMSLETIFVINASTALHGQSVEAVVESADWARDESHFAYF